MEQKIYVPIMNMAVSKNNYDGYLRELSRIKVDRLFISLERDALFLRDERRKFFLID